MLDADLHYEANSTVSATIPLKAGLHPIRIDYARTTGDPPTLDLLWQGPATPLATIPAIALFSDDGDDDDDGLNKSAEAAAGTSDYLKDSDEDGLEDNVDFDPNIANTAPAEPALSNQEIAENLIAPAIGILTATQNDIGDQLTWSLANGTGDSDNGGFSISGNVLSLVGSTDFETQASYSLRVRATDLGGLFTEQSFIITVTDDSIGLTSAEWHQNEFANAPVDWSADDDHDGLSRLLEYALLADPTADSSSSLPTISQVAGKTRFSYTRRATGFHDLIYQVESSPSLEPGTWQDATLTEVSVTPGPLPEEEQVLLEVPAPSPTGLFLRLRATRQP